MARVDFRRTATVVVLRMAGGTTVKERLIREIQQQMLPYLNNEQMLRLRESLEHSLHSFTICEKSESNPGKPYDAVAAFITAKRTEGCSEKTLSYYKKNHHGYACGH